MKNLTIPALILCAVALTGCTENGGVLSTTPEGAYSHLVRQEVVGIWDMSSRELIAMGLDICVATESERPDSEIVTSLVSQGYSEREAGVFIDLAYVHLCPDLTRG